MFSEGLFCICFELTLITKKDGVEEMTPCSIFNEKNFKSDGTCYWSYEQIKYIYPFPKIFVKTITLHTSLYGLVISLRFLKLEFENTFLI